MHFWEREKFPFTKIYVFALLQMKGVTNAKFAPLRGQENLR
jgi:hypothetical protein